MKLATHVPIHLVHEILSEIQRALWLDTDTEGDFWNANKEWDPETLECIASVLEEHGLRPDGPGQCGDRPSQVEVSEHNPVPDEIVMRIERGGGS